MESSGIVVEVYIQIIGRTLSLLPEFLLRGLCQLLGALMVRCTPRRSVYLSNIAHAFPDRDLAWVKRMAYQCAAQDFELFFLSITSPHMKDAELLDRIRMEPEHRERLARVIAEGKGVLALVPHVTLIESLTVFPLIDERFNNFGTMYRPLDFKPADNVVRGARSRYGVKLFATRKAVLEVRDHLKAGGLCGFLYDQNGGYSGALTLLFERVCSTTELHAVFLRNTQCRVVLVHPRRTGFWRGTIEVEVYEGPTTAPEFVVATNAWLENLLRSDEAIVPSWLWGHKRWKHPEVVNQRFRLDGKKNYLPQNLEFLGLNELPKTTRLWFLIPDSIESLLCILPHLRAIRTGRPDARITVLSPPGFGTLLEQDEAVDEVIVLPEGRWARLRTLWRLRLRLPDTLVCFEENPGADWAAWLTRARQRFGVCNHKRRRPLLTDCWKAPAEWRGTQLLSPELVHAFLKHFGLQAEPSYAPVFARRKSRGRVALLLSPKVEGEPERWPADHRARLTSALRDALPDHELVDVGTGLKANKLGSVHIEAAPIATCVQDLLQCDCAIGADSDTLHLANALGVPVLCLFSAHTPEEREPVFDAPVRVLRPRNDPDLPGDKVSDIKIDEAVACVQRLLSASPEETDARLSSGPKAKELD